MAPPRDVDGCHWHEGRLLDRRSQLPDTQAHVAEIESGARRDREHADDLGARHLDVDAASEPAAAQRSG